MIPPASIAGWASAYLDPGTGNYFLQLLFGALVAILASLRFFWSRLRSLFHRKPPGSRKEGGP